MTTSIATPVRDDRAAVDKAVSLLLAFEDQTGAGLGVSELARRAQLSKSTAFRVLGMLERNGVVERIGTGYRLGARLHQLGASVYSPECERLRDLLLPYLTDLYESTHHTVHLAARYDSEVVYLAKLYGHRTVAVPSRIGGRLPAHCTAVGKALLAYRTDPGGPVTEPRRMTPHSVTDPVRLADELSVVRRTGIAYEEQESRLGVSCMAAPVFDGSSRAVAAFSIAGRHGQLDTRRLEPVLRRICAAASKIAGRAQPVRVP
ncbi:IclR family transcriptional regulator [Nocardia sp. alder85J]|uniref:IclR family transcriptional regulator n=1 Tax=Nocardia sp. alder85J TaxID=2862949 RepID=UPI001CD2B9B4|nr:IclR family transcriptional regulator [Nocardia sp. alder85J]MCX4091058.1 IclR family transcriptional regulator [Nocardia sp. alder85J]